MCVPSCAGSACVYVCVCDCVLSVLIPSCPWSFLSLFPPNVFRVSRDSLSLSDPSVPDGLALPWLKLALNGVCSHSRP